MYIMVIGCGRLGAGLARVLSSQGNDVVVLSERMDLKWLGSEFDGVTLEGEPTSEAVLVQAGIEKADILVAATSDDVTNAMVAQIARQVFRVPTALARMTDPAREVFYRSLGVDTVCPTSTGINQILDVIQKSTFARLKGYLDNDLAGIRPSEEWIGKPLGDLSGLDGRTILGLERKGRLHSLDPAMLVAPGDVLILRRQAEGRRS